jgi:hypothetical protein
MQVLPPRKGLEGCGRSQAALAAAERSGEAEAPKSPVFCGVPQKMRPNFV